MQRPDPLGGDVLQDFPSLIEPVSAPIAVDAEYSDEDETDLGPSEWQVEFVTYDPRLLALDVYRGGLLLLMTWSLMRVYSAQLSGWEAWSGSFIHEESTGYAITRIVCNLCAPGLFYLMGISMSLLACSRQIGGWSHWRIVVHFIARALLLMLLDRVANMSLLGPSLSRRVHSPHSKHDPLAGLGHDWYFPLIGVIGFFFCLGACMLFCGLLMPTLLDLRHRRLVPTSAARLASGRLNSVNFNLGSSLAFLLACACLFVSSFVVEISQNDPGADKPFPLWKGHPSSFGELLLRFTVLPGEYQYGVILFPFLPWMGLVLFGIASGFEFSGRSSVPAAFTRCWVNGTLCLVMFCLIRYYGGSIFSFRGYPVSHKERAATGGGLMSFFNLTQFPPSISFVLFTLGANLLVLSAATQLLSGPCMKFWYLWRHLSSPIKPAPADLNASPVVSSRSFGPQTSRTGTRTSQAPSESRPPSSSPMSHMAAHTHSAPSRSRLHGSAPQSRSQTPGAFLTLPADEPVRSVSVSITGSISGDPSEYHTPRSDDGSDDQKSTPSFHTPRGDRSDNSSPPPAEHAQHSPPSSFWRQREREEPSQTAKYTPTTSISRPHPPTIPPLPIHSQLMNYNTFAVLPPDCVQPQPHGRGASVNSTDRHLHDALQRTTAVPLVTSYLATIGRVSLVFTLLYMHVLALCATVLFYYYDSLSVPAHALIPVWFGIVISLYPVTMYIGRANARKPFRSHWRLC